MQADLAEVLAGGGRLLRAGVPDYDKARVVFNRMHDRRPTAIVQPFTTDCVPAVVDYCSSRAVPIAVRGGGHHIGGFSTLDDGIVLDFSQLRQVEVRGDRADVAPGALLRDVDGALVPAGRVVPLGTVSATGVAGLTLGGGLGWLLGDLGATCDQLEAVTLVSADGQVRHLDDETAPEAMWALRGGDESFGIVTSFTFATAALKSVVCGTLRMPLDDDRTRPALSDLVDWMNSSPDRGITVAGAIQPRDGRVEVDIDVCAHGVAAARVEDVVALFPHARRIDFRTWDLREWQSKDDASFSDEKRGYWKSTYYERATPDVLDALFAVARAMPEGASITMEHLHGRFGVGDRSALPIRDCRLGLLASARWWSAADDTAHIQWVRRAAASLAAHGASRAAYLNYSMAEDAEGAVRRDADRLREVKREWDPQDFFRRRPAPPQVIPSAGVQGTGS